MRLDDAAATARAARAHVVGGCATRPINPRIERFDSKTPYTFERPSEHPEDHKKFVMLAFSGRDTRAAAFSCGALETLRDLQVTARSGRKLRALDEVDIITGISGGSFTALAYGLYGDKLFDDYEKRFLKRGVQGELIARAFKPFNWGELVSTVWGRSELAADYYDEILFNGATYKDLKPDGPLIFVGATDIADGAARSPSLGDKPVVLMCGYGNVATGPSLQVAAFRAVYTEVNARLELQAIGIGGPITALTPTRGPRPTM